METGFQTAAQLRDFLVFACGHDDADWQARAVLAREAAASFCEAAVLMPFDWNGGAPQVWLTERSRTLRQHAGQVAFPGGKKELYDASHEATALRETEEELGAAAEVWDIVGTLPDCYVPSSFVVKPVAALCRYAPEWRLCSDEVETVFAVPLAHALNGKMYRSSEQVLHGRAMTVYELPFDGHHIWGATAAMLHHMARSFDAWRA